MKPLEDNQFISLVNAAIIDPNLPLDPLRDYLEERQYTRKEISWLSIRINLDIISSRPIGYRWWSDILKQLGIGGSFDSDEVAIPHKEIPI